MSNSSLIGSLPIFNHESQDWLVFKERFQQWCVANELLDDEKSQVRRRAILLSALAEVTYKLVRDLSHPKDISSLTYKEVLKLLDDHFLPRKCIIGERHMFHAALQTPGEELNEWAARVRSLATHCKFTSLDETLRDRFVLGMEPGPARDKLFTEDASTLTLAKALDIAQGLRCARAAARLVTPGTTRGYMHPLQEEAANVNRISTRQQQNRGNIHCSVCGYTSHSANACKFAKHTCKQCGVKGHLKRMCTKKNRSIQKNHNYVVDDSADVGDDDDDGKGQCIYNIRTQNGEAMMQNVNINGTTILFEVDSGSFVTTISDLIYRKHFNDIPLSNSSLVLKVYTGGKIYPLGLISLPVTYENDTKILDIHVIADGGPPLLGRNFMSAFNLQISKINHIKTENIVKSLTSKYPEVFSDRLGCFNKHTVSLYVKPDSKPIFMKARSVPFALKEKVDQELNRMVQEGILKSVQHSNYASPIVPVLKHNGNVRICGDFSQTINKQLVVEKYPLPKIEELFAKLHGGVEFTKLDLSNAYMQLLLSEDAQPLTCINTHKGLFQYTRLIYGLSSASAIFQRSIENTLTGIEGVLTYQDDVLITGCNRQEHLNRLQTVLEKFREAGLVLRKEKCSFFQESISYLGFIIDKNGLHKSPEKVNAIVNAKNPENVTQLQSFLGLVNYYRSFVPSASTVLAPFYSLLLKNAKWNWSQEHEDAFIEIKKEMASDRVLTHFDQNATLILTVDASPSGLGAVLSQLENDRERPISYASRVLSSAEKNYSQIQKEATAIIFGVKRYHQYLYGRDVPFILRTDHKPLLSIFSPNKGVPEVSANRLQRYAIFLSAYNFTIEYVRSEKNCADFFSRAGVTDSDTNSVGVGGANASADRDRAQYINHIASNNLPLQLDDVREQTNKDILMKQVCNFVMFGWPKHCDQTLKPYYNCRYEISLENGCLMRGHKLIIPNQLRHTVLSELHRSHLGIIKTKCEARGRFWWPNIDKEIEVFIADCSICQTLRSAPPRVPLTPWPLPDKPWQRIHIDFLGPINAKTYLVIVDAYSKWVECFDMSCCTSTAVIDKLHELISHFGLMETIVSDNGTAFVSSEFKSFCKENGITHVTTPTYSPSSNGQAEIYVKIIKKGIKSIMASSSTKKDMQFKLRDFLLDYRNSKHSTTELSPAQIMLGRSLKSRLDLLNPHHQSSSSISSDTLQEIVRIKQCSQCNTYKGTRNVSFAPNETVLVCTYHKTSTSWIKAIIKEKQGQSIYLVYIPSLEISLKRHKNQIIKYKGQYDGLELDNDDSFDDWSPSSHQDGPVSTSSSSPAALPPPPPPAHPSLTPAAAAASTASTSAPVTHTLSDDTSDTTECASTQLVGGEGTNEQTSGQIRPRDIGLSMNLRDRPKVNYKQ